MTTVTKQLDALFAASQDLGSALKNDPNPHRSAYVRLIGELEAILLKAYGEVDADTRKELDRYIAGRVEAWQAMVAKEKMNEL